MVYNFRPVPNTDQGWSDIDTPGLLLETMVWYRHPWSIIRDHFFHPNISYGSHFVTRRKIFISHELYSSTKNTLYHIISLKTRHISYVLKGETHLKFHVYFETTRMTIKVSFHHHQSSNLLILSREWSSVYVNWIKMTCLFLQFLQVRNFVSRQSPKWLRLDSK